jgi:hypothetical protein
LRKIPQNFRKFHNHAIRNADFQEVSAFLPLVSRAGLSPAAISPENTVVEHKGLLNSLV